MADEVKVSVAERVATITLNRPEVRNAIDGALLDGLHEAVSDLEGDDSVDVLVLTGADPAFCAGLDLKVLGAGGLGARHVSDGRNPMARGQKPLIGAINGATVTGGPRDRPGLRLPDRLGSGPLRRHPRPGRDPARVGLDRAAAPGHRRAPGPPDEHHRQLRGRPDGAGLGPGQPGGGPRRPAGHLPGAGSRHRVQRSGRLAPHPHHLCRGRGHHRRRGLAQRVAGVTAVVLGPRRVRRRASVGPPSSTGAGPSSRTDRAHGSIRSKKPTRARASSSGRSGSRACPAPSSSTSSAVPPSDRMSST